MRQLLAYPDKNEAQIFSDFLETLGIQSQVREQANGFGVWVLKDDDLEQARAALKDFDVKSAAVVQRKAAALRKERERNQRPAFAPRVGSKRDAPVGPVGAGVAVLIALSVLVTVLREVEFAPIELLFIAPGFFHFGAFAQLLLVQPWRLVTPIFIHLGILHIVFNMMWLRQLGGSIEEREGTLWFLSYVMIAGAVSNFAQFYFKSPWFGGMSGVNYALFAYCWMQARYAPRRGYAISSSTTGLMMVWLVLCGTGMMGGVANIAHAAGLVVGLLAGAPSLFRFMRTYSIKTTFEKGSWEDLHILGWARFRRLVIEPYLPLWFLATALLVAVWDAR